MCLTYWKCFKLARSWIRKPVVTNYLFRNLLRENGEIIVETSTSQLRQIPGVCCRLQCETTTWVSWHPCISVLLSIYQRSSANIHCRPTDESSISSKSAVHFLKMIHLRDFAPFICFIERRILFSRSGIKLCCFQISPTLRWSQARASPLRRRRPQPGGHPGLGFNHINQVPANPYLQHFHQFNKRFSWATYHYCQFFTRSQLIIQPFDILIGPCHQLPLTACLSVSGLIPRTGNVSPRSASRPSCTAGITSPRSPPSLSLSPGPPAAAPAAPAPATTSWTTPSLISQEQTNKCSNNLSKLHCVPQ